MVYPIFVFCCTNIRVVAFTLIFINDIELIIILGIFIVGRENIFYLVVTGIANFFIDVVSINIFLKQLSIHPRYDNLIKV